MYSIHFLIQSHTTNKSSSFLFVVLFSIKHRKGLKKSFKVVNVTRQLNIYSQTQTSPTNLRGQLLSQGFQNRVPVICFVISKHNICLQCAPFCFCFVFLLQQDCIIFIFNHIFNLHVPCIVTINKIMLMRFSSKVLPTGLWMDYKSG